MIWKKESKNGVKLDSLKWMDILLRKKYNIKKLEQIQGTRLGTRRHDWDVL